MNNRESKARIRWIAVGVGILLLIVGHYLYWYGARARAAAPDDDLPARLLVEESLFPLALWMPYPHQNLGALDRGSGLDGEALRAALRLAGLPEPALPGFGGLSVPPARSLAVATDLAGERFVVMARVYPLFAGFARLSGWIANNPWLGGGLIRLEDRTLEVTWKGTAWCVGTPALPPHLLAEAADRATGDALARARAAGPALLWADVRSATDPIPVGLYGFRARDGVLELASTGPAERSMGPSASDRVSGGPPSMDEAGALLLAYRLGRPVLDEPTQAMVLYSHDPTDVAELPRASVLHDGSGKRWDLPAEGLLELAGRLPDEAEVPGWRLVATDDQSLHLSRGLVADLDRLSGSGEDGLLEVGLWLELERASIEAGRLRRGLEASPLAGSRQLERWTEAERLLSALAGHYGWLSLEIRQQGAEAERGLRLRIE